MTTHSFYYSDVLSLLLSHHLLLNHLTQLPVAFLDLVFVIFTAILGIAQAYHTSLYVFQRNLH